MERLVFDTSAILNFGKRGECEFVLERLGQTHAILTTPDVVRELSDPATAAFYRDLLARRFNQHKPRGAKIALAEVRRLTGFLGGGELSVMLLASELDATAVLDERIARLEAEQLKLKVTGTLGLLNRGYQQKWMSDEACIEIVHRLHRNGFRIRRPGANESFFEYFSNP